LNQLFQKLLCGGSAFALVSILPVAGALAQTTPATTASAAAAPADAAAADTIETVTVTGTQIRGITPVGQNVITVGTQDIQAMAPADTEQVLAQMPSLMSFGSSGQGQTGSSATQPCIHSLGCSGTNSTLVLYDGHRMVTSGVNHSEPDPGFLPVNMIERVEVLADGASSTYGSDAIAGVVNLITRSRFDGIQLDGQSSFAAGKSDWYLGFLAGKEWSDGSAIIAFTNANQGQLLDTARPWTNWNHLAQGITVGTPQGTRIPGENFNTFACNTATIQPTGSTNIYTSATSGVALANNAANSPCNQWGDEALIPHTVRNNGMIKVTEDFGSSWTLTGDIVFSSRRDTQETDPGTLTAVAYKTGPQANPFYQTPVGYTGTATSETIRWDAAGLLPPGTAANGSDTEHGDFNMEYRAGDKDGTPFGDFVFDLLGVAGHDQSFSYQYGVLNPSVATLALNGTTNTSGSLTTPVPNTNIVYTQLPLTAATALDVWNPAASNKTSSAVVSALNDQGAVLPDAVSGRGTATSGVEQFRLTTNGTVWTLPAGPVKIALGSEYVRYQLTENSLSPNGSGPADTGSTDQYFDFSRAVYSFDGELDIPLLSPEMDIPFAQKVTFDVSGRYDHYSDFGSTANPKFALDWKVNNDLKLRGDISTSFVAPPIDVIGNQYGASEIASYGATTNNINIPTAIFPTVTQMGIAGCTAASTSCNISSLQGVSVSTGNHNGGPAHGRGWTAGVDYSPSYLPGLALTATYWRAEILGASQSPTIGYAINSAGEAHLLSFYPGAGATQAQLAQFTKGVLATSALPTTIQYIFYSPDSPFVSLKEEGIDSSINYEYATDHMGTFNVGESSSILTKGYEALAGSAWYHIINTSGLNNNNSTIGTQVRGNFGWNYDVFSSVLYADYTGPYRYMGTNSDNPVLTCTAANGCPANAIGNPVGGGDNVKATVSFDLHLSYDVPNGLLGDDLFSLTVLDLLDTRPPYVNTAIPIDRNASALGRYITLGVTAKL
jgi:iron complex outermembrane recepter protein